MKQKTYKGGVGHEDPIVNYLLPIKLRILQT